MKNFLWNPYASLLVLALLASGCTDDGLPKYNVLGELRVLALVSQPAEVNPGDTVTVTPLVSALSETTSLHYQALVCLDPGVSLGVEPTCANSASKVELANTNISTLNTTVAFTGVADALTFTVPDATTLFSLRSPHVLYNGVSYLFEYILQNSSGVSVKSFKRILVSDPTKTTKNSNPVIADILLNSVSATTLPLGTKNAIQLSYTTSQSESYTKMNSKFVLTNEQEELVTTWFISDGKMKYQRSLGTDSNEYEGPASAPLTRPAFIIAVVRDGRGGVGYLLKSF
jgi:hypothetical protein